MDSRRLRVSPALVVAGLALLFALGGSAFAIGQRAAVPQQRCQNGAVRAIAVVTGIPGQGIENLPGQLHVQPTGVRPALQLHRQGDPGEARLERAVRRSCAGHLGSELPRQQHVGPGREHLLPAAGGRLLPRDPARRGHGEQLPAADQRAVPRRDHLRMRPCATRPRWLWSAEVPWGRASPGTSASSGSKTWCCVERDVLAVRLDEQVGRRLQGAVRRRAERPHRPALARRARADGRRRAPPARLSVPARQRRRRRALPGRARAAARARGAVARAVRRRGARRSSRRSIPRGCSRRRSASSTATSRPRTSSSGTRAAPTSARAARSPASRSSGVGSSACETTQGRIATETVVCCAGAWSQEVGAMAGVDIPVRGRAAVDALHAVGRRACPRGCR